FRKETDFLPGTYWARFETISKYEMFPNSAFEISWDNSPTNSNFSTEAKSIPFLHLGLSSLAVKNNPYLFLLVGVVCLFVGAYGIKTKVKI
ncbi:hypothetical protein, partial [Companilactobacillus mishanensis]|uniref:hypothetical protein n=1 Tax=Companilactobacillus mishanensis TaxID=2486008 RepID=UPI001EE19D74